MIYDMLGGWPLQAENASENGSNLSVPLTDVNASIEPLHLAVWGEQATSRSALVRKLRQLGDRKYAAVSTIRPLLVTEAPAEALSTYVRSATFSSANVAILVVDTCVEYELQVRRHAVAISLTGIRNVVLAIDKVDLVSLGDEPAYRRIASWFETLAKTLGFETAATIPIDTLRTDNVQERTPSTSWYDGPTLLDHLEYLCTRPAHGHNVVFPVQWVNQPHSGFHGFSGTLAQGQLRVGDEVRVTSSGERARVSSIFAMNGETASATAGDAVTICLDRDLQVLGGDVISAAQAPLETSNHFEATMIWLQGTSEQLGQQYDLKLASQWTSACLSSVQYSFDETTLAHRPTRQLRAGTIAVCDIRTTRRLAFDKFEKLPTLGGFILVDPKSGITVAAGMIRRSLHAGQNIHRHALAITRTNREILNSHRGMVVWLTGLSGSGKSTLANAIDVELHTAGMRSYILDGDNVRQGLNKDLGFGDADRTENIRRIAEVARLMMDAGLIVVTAFISPYRADRAMAEEIIGPERFIEVHVSATVDVCEARDPKGLYAKARQGKIPAFTGISSPYEPPLTPALCLDTGAMSLANATDALYQHVVRCVREGIESAI